MAVNRVTTKGEDTTKGAGATEGGKVPRARRRPAVAKEVKSPQVELVNAEVLVTPGGKHCKKGESIPCTAQERQAYLALKNDKGLPYFRDYVQPRKPRVVEEEAETQDAGGGEAGEIDTGAVKLPDGMKRSEGGVTV